MHKPPHFDNEMCSILFNNAPDVIFLCGVDGVIFDTNDEGVNLVGISKEELIGKNFYDLNIFAPVYGYFVDITGTYSTSNQVIQFLILLMPVIFYLFIKECYGGIYEE